MRTLQLQTQNKTGEIPRENMLEIYKARIAYFLARRPNVRTSQGSEEEGTSWVPLININSDNSSNKAVVINPGSPSEQAR